MGEKLKNSDYYVLSLIFSESFLRVYPDLSRILFDASEFGGRVIISLGPYIKPIRTEYDIIIELLNWLVLLYISIRISSTAFDNVPEWNNDRHNRVLFSIFSCLSGIAIFSLFNKYNFIQKNTLVSVSGEQFIYVIVSPFVVFFIVKFLEEGREDNSNNDSIIAVTAFFGGSVLILGSIYSVVTLLGLLPDMLYFFLVIFSTKTTSSFQRDPIDRIAPVAEVAWEGADDFWRVSYVIVAFLGIVLSIHRFVYINDLWPPKWNVRSVFIWYMICISFFTIFWYWVRVLHRVSNKKDRKENYEFSGFLIPTALLSGVLVATVSAGMPQKLIVIITVLIGIGSIYLLLFPIEPERFSEMIGFNIKFLELDMYAIPFIIICFQVVHSVSNYILIQSEFFTNLSGILNFYSLIEFIIGPIITSSFIAGVFYIPSLLVVDQKGWWEGPGTLRWFGITCTVLLGVMIYRVALRSPPINPEITILRSFIVLLILPFYCYGLLMAFKYCLSQR